MTHLVQPLLITVSLSATLLFSTGCQTTSTQGNPSNADLREHMSRYITLFNASDAQAIAEKIYSAPVQHVHPESGVHAVLETQADVQSFWAETFKTIKAKGWVQSVVHDLEFQMAGPDMAIASMTFSRLKSNGEAIAPPNRIANYLLLRSADGWRIIFVAGQRAEDKEVSRQTAIEVRERMNHYIDLLNGDNPAADVSNEIWLTPRISRGFAGAQPHSSVLDKDVAEEKLGSYLDQLKEDGLHHFAVSDTKVFLASARLAFVELVSSRLKEDGTSIPPANTPFTYIWLKKETGWRMIGTLAHKNEETQSNPIPFSIDRLDWLEGSWAGPISGGVLEEKWLHPKANTMAAIVRLTKGDQTEFVELIKIEQVGDTLELRLRLFDSELKPRLTEPRVHRATTQSPNSVTFRGVSPNAHQLLHYELTAPGRFLIRLETKDGEKAEIVLTPTKP